MPSPVLVGADGASSGADPDSPFESEFVTDLTLEAPDLSEPLTAFRRWRVVDGRLRSPYIPVFWDERILAARCHRQAIDADSAVPSHTPPVASCKCGIHAYSEPDVDFPAIDYRGVTGIVTVRGRVAVGPEGMRAELARVEALGVYSRWSRRQREHVLAIADRLGIDLVDVEDLAEAAERYGRPLLPETLQRLHADSRKSEQGMARRDDATVRTLA